MRFSIIVPVYNVEKYVKKCLESIVNQTYRDYEVIIVNDGSTDGSIRIVNQFIEEDPNRIRLINQQNKGLGGARNTGLENALGEYIVYLDSDDFISENMLGIINQYISNNQYDMIIFNSFKADEQGNIITKFNMCRGKCGELSISEDHQLLLIPPAAWNKIYRRDFLQEQDIQYPENTYYEDGAVTRYLLLNSKSTYYCEDYLYYYVQRDSSIIHDKKIDRSKDIIKVNDELLKLYRECNRFDEFYEELEYITINDILLFMTEKINVFDWKNSLQNYFVEYINNTFPTCNKNKYLSSDERLRVNILLEHDYKQYHKKYGKRIRRIHFIKGLMPEFLLRLTRKIIYKN